MRQVVSRCVARSLSRSPSDRAIEQGPLGASKSSRRNLTRRRRLRRTSQRYRNASSPQSTCAPSCQFRLWRRTWDSRSHQEAQGMEDGTAPDCSSRFERAYGASRFDVYALERAKSFERVPVELTGLGDEANRKARPRTAGGKSGRGGRTAREPEVAKGAAAAPLREIS